MSIFTTIGSKIAVTAGKAALTVSKHSPAILFVAGVTTGALSLWEMFKKSPDGAELVKKHTEKLEQVEDAKEHPDQYQHPDGSPINYKADKKYAITSLIKDVIHTYWKPLLLAGISVVCFGCSFHILNSRLIDTAALASSALATNRKLEENITTKYGESEYRNLLYSEKDDILKQVKAPELHELTDEEKAELQKDPWRKYNMPETEQLGDYDFDYNENTVSERTWINSKVMMLMTLKSKQDMLNQSILPTKGILTMNQVLDELGLQGYKNSAHHIECWVYGKHTIDLGIDDIFEDLEEDINLANAAAVSDPFGSFAKKYDMPIRLHIVPGSNIFAENVANWRGN
jgi:hypothetical protein